MNSSSKYAMIAIAVVVPIAIFVIYASSEMDAPQTPAASDVEPVDKPLIVLTSFFPIEQFVLNVGGDRVEPSMVVPPGISPHDWEPTIREVQRMQSADVMVFNGVGFETWVDDLDGLGFDGVLVDTSVGIPIMEMTEGQGHGHDDDRDEHGDDDRDEHGDDDRDEHGDDDRDEHGDDDRDEHGDEHALGDPHIWLSPVHAQAQVQNVAAGLSEADPANAGYYYENAARYIEQLKQLDADIREQLEPCSDEFIAFHQAFTYFAAEYDLVQHTITKSSEPHGDVGLKTLHAIIDTAKEQGITTIFTEEGVDTRMSQVIADEMGGKVLVLSPLEIAESDETYISKMYDNLESLKVALCQES